jgi:hypothetical protein
MTIPTDGVPPDGTPDEVQLSNEVKHLWEAHAQAHSNVRKTRSELKEVRARLSQNLYELKAVLCRPGRGGAWASFLGAQGIPRSSADSLVRAYEKTSGVEAQNLPTGQIIPEPSDLVIGRYVRALWPKLMKTLTTPEAVEMFVAELRRLAENSMADKESNSPVPDHVAALCRPGAGNNPAILEVTGL